MLNFIKNCRQYFKRKADELHNPVDAAAPYYIHAPNFSKNSAGIRVLYTLCDQLRRRGYDAYIVGANPLCMIPETLKIRFLDKKVALQHFANGQLPIVLYSEVVHGNSLNAPFYIRYYLNYHKHFGVDLSDDEPNLIYVYSNSINEVDGFDADRLFIPVVKRSVFHLPSHANERSGSCYAAMKFKYFHGQEPFDVPEGSVEITRDLRNSLTTEQVADLFRRCEYFYCFDNTALAIEATLCGCLTVMMPNKYLSKESVIAKEEFGGLPGIAWNNSKEEIERAKAELESANQSYEKVLQRTDAEIDAFIVKTQQAVSSAAYTHCINTRVCYPLAWWFLRGCLKYSAIATYRLLTMVPPLRAPLRKVANFIRGRIVEDNKG